MNSKDLTGKRFGNLIVLNKEEGLQDRYYKWKCICDCGNEIIVNTRNLTNNRTTHCGCRAGELCNIHQKPKDRTGMRYGALTAIKMVGKTVNGEFLWECECECGNHINVPALKLEKYVIKDCGCGSGEKNRYKDLTGKRKGRLTALYPTDKRDIKGSVIWHCRCDCGNETDINESDFVFGRSISCGCARQERWEDIILSEWLTFVDGTCVEWLSNRKSRSDNTSGFRGVYKTGNEKKPYRVSIGLQGKKYDLGRYESFEKAVNVRLYVEKYLHDGFVHCWKLWNEKADHDKQWADENPFFYEVVKGKRSFIIYSPMAEPITFQY